MPAYDASFANMILVCYSCPIHGGVQSRACQACEESQQQFYGGFSKTPSSTVDAVAVPIHSHSLPCCTALASLSPPFPSGQEKIKNASTQPNFARELGYRSSSAKQTGEPTLGPTLDVRAGSSWQPGPRGSIHLPLTCSLPAV